MRPTHLLHASGGLLLAVGLAAFAGPSVGAGAESTHTDTALETSSSAGVAPAADSSPVTVDLSPSGHAYVRSAYAEQARQAPTTTTTTTTTAPPPPPPPPPPPAPAGSIDEIINRYFGPAAGRAKAIAQCESNMNPNAVSPTNDHGLFQINHVHRGQFESVTGAPWSSVYDPEMNTKYAKWLYDQQGWGPWACSRKV